MSYDIEKWSENDIRNRQRNKWSRWAIGFGISFAVLIAMVSPFVAPGYEFVLESAILFMGLAPIWIGIYYSPFARHMLLYKLDPEFDEYEVQAMGQASQRAYNILLVAIVLFLAWCYFGVANDWPLPSSNQDWFLMVLVFFNAGGALPVLLAETTVPFPPENTE